MGIISFALTEELCCPVFMISKQNMFLSADEKGSEFFFSFTRCEQKNLDVLLVAPLPDSISESLRDRISRAAAGDG